MDKMRAQVVALISTFLAVAGRALLCRYAALSSMYTVCTQFKHVKPE